MVHLRFSIDLHYDIAAPGADFIFNLQAATTRHQHVVSESLLISQPLTNWQHTCPSTQTRWMRLRAHTGHLHVAYVATVDVTHHTQAPGTIAEVPVALLPPEVLIYLYPSRYCPSDQLAALAMREFGLLPQGYNRVLAVQTWVRKHVTFQSNSSTSTTSALDTLADRVGVCRDFAHLMITLCRALNLPARFTTGIDYGADPALGPTDFHAYVEVFLDGRWYIFDPSGTAIPMGFVRIGTGRDAADMSFATIFGPVVAHPPTISIEAVVNPHAGWSLPTHQTLGLSTDDGLPYQPTALARSTHTSPISPGG